MRSVRWYCLLVTLGILLTNPALLRGSDESLEMCCGNFNLACQSYCANFGGMAALSCYGWQCLENCYCWEGVPPHGFSQPGGTYCAPCS